jgi:hypothetical protein
MEFELSRIPPFWDLMLEGVVSRKEITLLVIDGGPSSPKM